MCYGEGFFVRVRPSFGSVKKNLFLICQSGNLIRCPKSSAAPQKLCASSGSPFLYSYIFLFIWQPTPMEYFVSFFNARGYGKCIYAWLTWRFPQGSVVSCLVSDQIDIYQTQFFPQNTPARAFFGRLSVSNSSVQPLVSP